MAPLAHTESHKKKNSVVNGIIDGLTGIFMPIVNLMSAAGICKGLLVILLTIGAVSKGTHTYMIFNAIGDGLFYFLPVLLAVTSAKKFGANQYTAMIIAGILLYPELVGLFKSGEAIFFMGMPVVSVAYPYSVIPIILAVGLQSFVEKWLNKIVPELVRGFLTALVTILFVSTVTFLVLGPIGKVIGDVLGFGYHFVYNLNHILAGFCLGFSIQLMVIFGFQWGIIPIAISNVATTGSDTILACIGPAVFAQAGAALAVFVKTKNKEFKTVALSAAVSSFFGVTEPALFGVNLPLKKPLMAVCIAGGIGGAIVGFSGASAMAFAFASVATLPVFIGKGFGLFVAACTLSGIMSFVLTMLFKFDTPE